MEEHCRIGIAIAKFIAAYGADCSTYLEFESHEGFLARTISDYTDGHIKTLSTGLHDASSKIFQLLRRRDASYLYNGYFFDLSLGKLSSEIGQTHFNGGFDFIHELCTFQFYGACRTQQIKHLKSLLKRGGVCILLEKILHFDSEEYERREIIKDRVFKSKYFSQEEIAWKREHILSTMSFQCDLPSMIHALQSNFANVYLLWNGGNFYEFCASDDAYRLDRFFDCLSAPFLPLDFGHEAVLTPRRLSTQ